MPPLERQGIIKTSMVIPVPEFPTVNRDNLTLAISSEKMVSNLFKETLTILRTFESFTKRKLLSVDQPLMFYRPGRTATIDFYLRCLFLNVEIFLRRKHLQLIKTFLRSELYVNRDTCG